jgi:hypothetical protein
MAVRYLIPGGDGNASDTSNWSTSSGGAPGASVPGAGDDIIVDVNSSNTPLIFDNNREVQSITVDDYNGTISIDATLTIFGSTAFLLFNSIFTLNGTGLLTIQKLSTTTTKINTGNVVVECDVRIGQRNSGNPSGCELQHNLTVAGTLDFSPSNSALAITGNFNIIALGDVRHFSLSTGANNAHVNFNVGALVFAGTTPQTLTSNTTAACNWNVRTIFNSTSDVVISNRQRIVSTTYNWFTYVSGNVYGDSTQELRVVQSSFNIASGEVRWNRLYMQRTSLQQTITLHSDFYTNQINSDYPTGSNHTNRWIRIRSNNSDTRKFVLAKDGTQSNVFQWESTAQIDSTDGQIIWSIRGTDAPERGWRVLLPPQGTGYGSIG